MTTPDYLTAQHPDVVAVSGQRFIGKSVVQEIKQERLEGRNDALADGDIAPLYFPGVRPGLQVRAIVRE